MLLSKSYTNMNTSELYTQLLDYAEKNDEQGAKDFLLEHLNDFPQEEKENIIFFFFSETVEKELLIDKIKSEGLDLFKKIDKEERNLEDQQKIEDIKKDILG